MIYRAELLPEQCTVPARSAAKDINQRRWRGGRVSIKAAEASETCETAEEAETTGVSAAAVRKEMGILIMVSGQRHAFTG